MFYLLFYPRPMRPRRVWLADTWWKVGGKVEGYPALQLALLKRDIPDRYRIPILPVVTKRYRSLTLQKALHSQFLQTGAMIENRLPFPSIHKGYETELKSLEKRATFQELQKSVLAQLQSSYLASDKFGSLTACAIWSNTFS